MALSTPFVGSGEFVPEREWLCSQHDYPHYHECDCSSCTIGEWECAECSTSEWRGVFNDDGTPRMRELGAFEAMLLKIPGPVFPMPAFASLLAGLGGGVDEIAKVEWAEDELMPRTSGR